MSNNNKKKTTSTDNARDLSISGQSIVNRLVIRFKRIRLIVFFANIFLLSLFLVLLSNLFEYPYLLTTPLLLIFVLIALYIFIHSKQYKAINAKNISLHINRHDEAYQESAQLVLGSINKANPLKCLQRDKIEKILIADFQNGKLDNFRPTVNFKSILLLLYAIIFFFVAGNQIKWILIQPEHTSFRLHDSEKNTKTSAGSIVPVVTSSKIQITPPDYTGLKQSTLNKMDVKVPEGSRLTWSLNFSQSNYDYYYYRSKNQRNILIKNGDLFSINDTINQTSLYSFSYKSKQSEGQLDGIYSITVLRDKAPKITVVQPNRSLIEIQKNATAEFTLKANISDDYQISDIEILASVAKGSGEAVKFRDKVFRFHNNSYSNNNLYTRHWSLQELGMEPGDEVYFRITATDNKQPLNQSTQSSTIIVRWLDDYDAEMTAEGVQIGFIPEYFRSQRQIIIETEQLISDKRDLKVDQFKNISIDLGHSQSDLKQKYGQYLGDEFGEGPSEQFGLADGYHGGESHSAGEASAGVKIEQEHQQEEEPHSPEHLHQQENEISTSTDKSGANEIIQQFTHSHGTTEIGPISSRDPKSWMKMAVNEMWQAELHLMLSEPKRAIPFEYKAYEYLKRARQAERIYAKRLGFEPPPVTEERRLSGELQDILEYDLSYMDQKNTIKDNILFKQAYRLISQLPKTVTLNQSEIAVFSKLSAKLLELSESRSVLVKYATISEKIALLKSISINDCEQCTAQLKIKLWQLLSRPTSLPNTKNKQHNFPLENEISYFKALKRLRENND